VTDPVKAIHLTGNNSDLILSCARLGYLRDAEAVLDATYGLGTFWKKWRPASLVANDLDPDRGYWHFDFRDLPWKWEEAFDAVVFDPDYKLQGTSSNAGPASSNARYGMDREYRSVTYQLYDVIFAGLDECVRALKPDGILLVKCMDQVVSGDVVWMSFDIKTYVEKHLACRLIDLFQLEGMRAQPQRTRKCPVCKGDGFVANPNYDADWDPAPSQDCLECTGSGRVESPQQHAARNYSTLLVFRKGRDGHTGTSR